jgi:hypothetical protein
VADTRNPAGVLGGPVIAGGSSRDFVVPASACAIPSTAQAYSLNVAVVPAGALGYLTLWPRGQEQPLVSTLNSDGRIKSNAAIASAGAGGAISAFASSTTDLVLDINGYFVPASDPTARAFYPITPCRIADTRNTVGPLGGPSLVGDLSRTFPIPVATACNIPAGVQAYLTKPRRGSERSPRLSDRVANRATEAAGGQLKCLYEYGHGQCGNRARRQ